MSDSKVVADREEAIRRHEVDSGMFQGRYVNFEQGKYTDAFIYGRYQILEDCRRALEGLPAGARVLDLGCGTGHFCKTIRDMGHEPIGLEPAQEMLKFARANFPDIEFQQGVSIALPFADGSFDLVICIEVLRYLNPRDVADTYSEMRRVLKPGGKIFVTHVNLWASDFYFFYYHILGIIKKIKGESYHNCYFTTARGEEKLLRNAGFESIRVWGRLSGLVRFAFKFGAPSGRFWAKVYEHLDPTQKWEKGLGRDLAGHLLLTAEKGAS